MLSRRRSLAFRAGLIFAFAYAAIFLAAISISAAVSWADRGAGNLYGAVVARNAAVADLRFGRSRPQLVTHGAFRRLASRNPAAWLVVLSEGRAFSWGAADPAQVRIVANFRPLVEPAVFLVPGRPAPIGAGAGTPIDRGAGPVFVAAGGIDPATLSGTNALHLLLEPEVAAMLIVIAVLSLLGTVAAARIFSRTLAPIALEAAAIGPGDPGRRLDEQQAPRELLPVVRGFNAALDRLQQELGRRKRFISDVAHELRTPLAVVSLQADALPEDERKADLRRGLARVTRLLSQMLDLERLTVAARPREDIDLVAVTRDTVADLAPMAVDRGYDLSLAAPDRPVPTTGDPHAAARALTNLIGNAIAHGGGRGRIDVTVGTDRTVTVADQGPGVAADLAERLFEPFVRGHAREEGSGLGLHLTREIMRAAGGEVRYVGGTGGATFRLTFPPPAGAPAAPVERDGASA